MGHHHEEQRYHNSSGCACHGRILVPAERSVNNGVRRVATAMRVAYGCEGTSTRQHNEPAGGQDVWHLHVHVFPRFADDALYQRHDDARWVTVDERRPFADKLRSALQLPTTFA
nr:HIT domain-containing protein [Ornithinimicrobium sp. HY1745]